MVQRVRWQHAERGRLRARERESVEVKRRTRSGTRVFDTRGAVATLAAEVEPAGAGVGGYAAAPVDSSHTTSCAILRLVVRHHTPAVRPDDILSGLRATAGLAPPVPPEVTRLAQGPFDEESGTVADSLMPDRAAATAVRPTAEPRAALAQAGPA